MTGFERILLTGGGGFVGSYLAPLLAAACPNASRFMLVKPNEPFREANWTPRIANLLDKQALEAIVAETRPDLVVHLAGQASIAKAQADGTTTTQVNHEGSSNLAWALGRHARRTTVLFASSVAVYGASLKMGKIAENAPLDPLDAYGRSKVDAEAVLTSGLSDEARLIVARPVNHSGPRQDAKSFALSSFAAQIAAIELGRWAPRIIVGDLSKERDFLDVRDVVEAYVALARIARELPDRVGYFNIASGEAHSIGALLDRLCAIAGRDYPREIDPRLVRPPGSDLARIVCDASHLRATTGWAPRHSIDDLLRSLLEYWRKVDEAVLIAALPEIAPR